MISQPVTEEQNYYARLARSDIKNIGASGGEKTVSEGLTGIAGIHALHAAGKHVKVENIITKYIMLMIRIKCGGIPAYAIGYRAGKSGIVNVETKQRVGGRH